MNIELAKFLKRVCEDIGNQECEIREDYSGRGMFGKQTAGIVVDSVPMLLADMIQWVSGNICEYKTDADENGAGLSLNEWTGGEIPDISDLRVDNMGRSTILY
jgi:hypothetical protein